MRALVAGYEWAQEFTLEPAAPYFPMGATFRAQVRDRVGGTVLTTLTTADGTLTRVNDTTLHVTIPASASVGWESRRVVFDVARTDLTPDTHFGWRVELTVVQPVTRSTDA
jgi:hypothetical protein